MAGLASIALLVQPAFGADTNAPPTSDTSPKTNAAPIVRWVSPSSGEKVYEGESVTLSAQAKSATGSVVSVEFFANDKSLGLGHPLLTFVATEYTTYQLNWTNLAIGTYALKAAAKDSSGIISTSAPVTLIVQARPVPHLVVSITSPENNTRITAGKSIQIIASAAIGDKPATNVLFLANGTFLGAGLRTSSTSRSFTYTWTNALPGTNVLTAIATSDSGVNATSAPISLIVLPKPEVHLLVSITSPENNSHFDAGKTIEVVASAAYGDAAADKLVFMANGQFLANGIKASSTSRSFYYLWTNAPPGTNVLTAIGAVGSSIVVTSAPVNITILSSGPPPTNIAPIMSIATTDPIAVVGTNCWTWLGLTNPAPTWSNWIIRTGPMRPFTNCGPKDATFVVNRYGSTNNVSTIPISITGTASNGVDYVMLSNNIIIPAGQQMAYIAVAPLDSAASNFIKTVVLKLLPDTNQPAGYLIGFPGSAAALILDRPSLHRPTTMLPGQIFHLTANGPDAAWFHIEYTTNFSTWTPICTNQLVNGAVDFVDPDASEDNQRFYRIVPEFNPPF